MSVYRRYNTARFDVNINIVRVGIPRSVISVIRYDASGCVPAGEEEVKYTWC